MIHVDENGVTVTGPGKDVMTQLGILIRACADSLERAGSDPEYIWGFFHRLVDIARNAPSGGVTIDLSVKVREEGKP